MGFCFSNLESDQEIERDNKEAFREKIDQYLIRNTRVGLETLLFKIFKKFLK